MSNIQLCKCGMGVVVTTEGECEVCDAKSSACSRGQ